MRCPAANEAYRFLWLRSFHNPIVVRIERTGEHYELSATIMSGAGGYDPGIVSRRITKALSQSDWARLVAALDKLGFWTMPTEPAPSDDGIVTVGVDGANWIIEGRRDSHHVVDRWSGEDGVQAVGILMLTLAGIDLSKEEVY